jgi:uncharacterized membrane protein SpoIIM required for sporulation
MSYPLVEFIVGHGALELPAIWIAGGSGLLLAEALLLPGRYSRGIEMRLKGRKSVQIVVGLVPVLLVAAVIEGFVSPSSLPGLGKAFLGSALASALFVYIITAPEPTSEEVASQDGASA